MIEVKSLFMSPPPPVARSKRAKWIARTFGLKLPTKVESSDHARVPDPLTLASLVPAPGLEGDFPELEPTTYALGLAVAPFRGPRLVIHGGGIDGSGLHALQDDRAVHRFRGDIARDIREVNALVDRRGIDDVELVLLELQRKG